MENIVPIDQITNLSKDLHQQRKRIVLVGGCFDLLHLGHITLLEEAKKQGDILVVLLESDAKIQKLKGADRPLHTQPQRAHMLSALISVDYIVLLPDIIDNSGYDKLVNQLQPAIIATTRGSDSLHYMQKQAKETGAEIYMIEPIKNLSTSRILNVVSKEV